MTDKTSLKSLADFLGETDIRVVVPKIQRAYAQGRAAEVNIRTQFVDQIFNALEKDSPMVLNFVYGSKVKGKNGTRFELLDGQQRITTLVLLNWFLACANGKEPPAFIKTFDYETRTTTGAFLKALADTKLNVTDIRPSEALRNRQWYTLAFDKDNSVRGMLTMLDAFYDRYQASTNKRDLFENLNNLQFYELPLDDFGLTEEIYVKMNARGLQLTPFENFKADLIKLLKDESIPEFNRQVKMEGAGKLTVPYYLSFSQKLDNRWLDIFWDKNDADNREYCRRFFRFFYRFFATKFMVEIQKDMEAESFRPKKLPDNEAGWAWKFLWEESEKQDKNYLGFKYYNQFFRNNPEYAAEIERVLDMYAAKDVREEIKNEAVFPWDEKKGDKDEPASSEFFGGKYQMTEAVYFACVFEYLSRSTSGFDKDNFKRWMRVVRNVVENLLFRNIDQLVSTLRRLIPILDIPGGMSDIYTALASITPKENDIRTLKEEIQKARIITADPSQSWEKAFYEAELHPFFRGAIGFLLENMPAEVDKFKHRVELIGMLFDKDGMTPLGKENHRLLRAMIRLLNSKNLIQRMSEKNKEQPLTERQDGTNHLKVLMLEKAPIRTLLCELGDMDSINEVIEYLDKTIKDPQVEISDIADASDPHFVRAFKRLCLDVKVYEFISDIESENGKDKYVALSFRDNNVALGRPSSRYNWLFIGSERSNIIHSLLQEGYSLSEEKYADDYNKYGDYTQFRVWVKKQIINKQDDTTLEKANTHELSICFTQSGTARFLLKADDDEVKTTFPEAQPNDGKPDSGWLLIKEVAADQLSDIDNIRATAAEIEKELTSTSGIDNDNEVSL